MPLYWFLLVLLLAPGALAAPLLQGASIASAPAAPTLYADPPRLLEVVADVRPVTRLSTDPLTLQPRTDSFDMVYLAAYFSQPIYVRAVDGSRYAVRDLWHRPEAAQLAQAFELRCPRLPGASNTTAAQLDGSSGSGGSGGDGRDGHVTMHDADADTAAAVDVNDAGAEFDSFTFVPSPSVYPEACLRGAAARSGALAAPSPPFRWAEQVFGGAPPGSMRTRLPPARATAPAASPAAAAAAVAAAQAAEEAALLAALWGMDDDLLDPASASEGAHGHAAGLDDVEADEDEEDAHNHGLSDNMLPLVFVAAHRGGAGHREGAGRAGKLAACAGAAVAAPVSAARLATCRIVLPPPVRTPTPAPAGRAPVVATSTATASAANASSAPAAGAGSAAGAAAAAPGIAIVGALGAPIHVGLVLSPLTPTEAVAAAAAAATTTPPRALEAPVTVRLGSPVRLVSVAGPALDAAPTAALAAAAASDAAAASASASAATARLARARALADARRAACASTVAQERAAFIERSMATVTGIVQPVVGMMAGETVQQSNDLVLGGTSQPLTQDLTHALSGPLPSLVVTYVNKAVPRNLTHLITDAVAATLTNLLAAEIPNLIGGPIASRVYAKTNDIIVERLTRVLSQTMTRGVHDGLGDVIARELTLALTAKLTRSVTHALVPTLTRGLSTTYHFSYLCHLCTHYGTHCSDCNDLQVSQYMIQHYALQFSEYYAGYYGDYYRDAMFMLDQVQFSNPDYVYTPPYSQPMNPSPKGEPPLAGSIQNEQEMYSDLIVKAAKMAGDAAAGNGHQQTPTDTIALDPNRGLGGRGSAGYGGGTDTPGLHEVIVEGADNALGQAAVEKAVQNGYFVSREPIPPSSAGNIVNGRPEIVRAVPPLEYEPAVPFASTTDGTLRLNRFRLPDERVQGSQGIRVGDDRGPG